MKNLKVDTLRINIVVYVLVAMLLLSVIAIFSASFNARNIQLHKEKIYSKQLDNSMNYVVNYFLQDYSNLAYRIINTTNIADLLEKKDRKAMYKLLKPRFNIIQDGSSNINVMQIHLANGNSFLRVHKPKMYGDNIAQYRGMLRDIHKNHKKLSGYEIGKFAMSYRVINPIFNKNGKYIGAFEVGLNLNSILNTVDNINNFYSLLFIKDIKSQFSSKENKLHIAGYLLQSTLNAKSKKFYTALSKKGLLSDKLEIEVENKRYLTHLLVLNNFNAQDRVKLIFFQDITNIESFFNSSIYTLFGMIFLVLLFLTLKIYRRIGVYQDKINKIYTQQVDKIKESETKYIIEKNKLNNIFLAMEDGVYVVSENYDIEFVNQVLTKDFGEYKGRKCYEYFHGKSEVCEWCKNSEVHKGKTVRWTWTSDKNGKTYDLIDTPLYNADGTVSKLELFRDITQNQLVQDKLRLNENYLEAVFDIAPHIMITTNGEEIDRVNQQMLDFFEFNSIDEFQEKYSCICDLFIVEDGYLTKEVEGLSWLEYISKYQDKLHKVSMKKGDKNYRFIVKAHQLKYDDIQRSVVTFNDVTEIEDLRKRFDIAVNGTNDGLWDRNLETGDIYFSPQWKKQLGYEDDELENSLETWQNHVHPDDRKIAEADYAANIEGKTDSYLNIHRLRHKNGSWVWILDRGKTIFDENGKATRMVGFHTDITTQKELELQLKNSKEQFEKFMEYMPASILIKEDGIVVYSNSSANRFFNRNNIVGQTAHDLLPQDIADKVVSFEDKALQNGVNEDVLVLNGDKEKYYRNLCFAMNSMDTNKKTVGIVVIDITKEQSANKEIEKLLSAFERSDISILMTNLDAVIEYVNPKWCEVTGYSKEELIGQNPRIVKSEANKDSVYTDLWDQISSGKVWNGEIKNRAKDGKEFWEESTIVPSFNLDGSVNGYISFKSEISEKMLLRQEILDKDEIMIAQSRHAAMGEMISMIAHQWRQPISAIAMDANNILVDIELDMIDKNDLLETSENIIKQVRELSNTIDDFREFFKPDKAVETILLKKVLDDALGVIGKSLENNDIEIVLNLEDKVEIKTFSRELMQVLINLIKNSKEALIYKSISDKQIFIDFFKDEDGVTLGIKDSAGGIPSEVMDKIFEPYFTTKGERNGTGLGLYMSKIIVEKHLKGSIDVSNTELGAYFEIKLPLDLETIRGG